MRKLLLLILPALLIVAGCSPEQQWVGKYRGKIEMGKTMKSVVDSNPMGGQASSFLGMIQPSLDLRPDKTFTMTMAVAPIDGTWKLDHDTIILTPKTMMGMSADEVKKQAEKHMDEAKSKSPFPFPMAGGMPNLSEMKMSLNEKDHVLSLDPGSGTLFGGFGKIVFTKS
jgi:hypothetical protein